MRGNEAVTYFLSEPGQNTSSSAAMSATTSSPAISGFILPRTFTA